MFSTTHTDSNSDDALSFDRVEMRDAFDASMSCDIAAILETEIRSSGHAIVKCLPLKVDRCLWIQTSSDL